MSIIESVYVIYDADVEGEHSEQLIEQMSPEHHLPAGYGDGEGPYGREGREPRQAVGAKFKRTEGNDQFEYEVPEGTVTAHAKWVAELTEAEWRLFADAYLIELDEHGAPAECEQTLGSLTEYGIIPAVSVDLAEGWQDGRTHAEVVHAGAYVSISGEEPE